MNWADPAPRDPNVPVPRPVGGTEPASVIEQQQQQRLAQIEQQNLAQENAQLVNENAGLQVVNHYLDFVNRDSDNDGLANLYDPCTYRNYNVESC